MKKAFTLIELLVYIAISTIILFGIVDFVISIDHMKKRGSIIQEVENQGLNIANIITQKIRNADFIISPIVGNAEENLSLNMVSPNAQVSFTLQGTNLEMKDEFGNVEFINNNLVLVSGIKFINLTKSGTQGNIKIEFTLRYNNESLNSIYDYEKTFYTTGSLR
ncbi:MAG TPA: prepilin-type N-terminal cleavage/methylation domain-containing protein [bacterium]|nr:prepilin-type N-terminal cleavage/methylation domain-containing protein [bacterium]